MVCTEQLMIIVVPRIFARGRQKIFLPQVHAVGLDGQRHVDVVVDEEGRTRLARRGGQRHRHRIPLARREGLVAVLEDAQAGGQRLAGQDVERPPSGERHVGDPIERCGKHGN
jgi:hypothetical protein